jgi:hypothetical protein
MPSPTVLSPLIFQLKDPDLLSVYGLMLDSIKIVQRRPYNATHRELLPEPLEELCFSELETIQLLFPGKDIEEAYWQTLSCGLALVSSNPRLKQRLDRRPEVLNFWRLGLSSIRPGPFMGLKRWLDLTGLKKDKAREEAKRLLGLHPREVASRHKLIVTQNSHFAMVPIASRKGDIICAIYEGSVPFVLRLAFVTSGDEEKRWKLLGAAYMQGFMDGEPSRLRDEGRLTDRRFVLI